METGRAFARGTRLLRERLGMTQAQLAEAADLHEQFVSQLERGERSPGIETIDAVATALNVEPWELLRAGAAAASSKPAPRQGAAEQIRALLAAWPEQEQKRLVRLLIELRQIALAGARTGAPSAKRRGAKKGTRRPR